MLDPVSQSQTIGGKARGLLLFGRCGIPTPPWLVIPAEMAVNRPWQDTSAFSRRLRETLPAQRYIARSSAATEDSEASSQAGVFRSVVFEPEAPGPALDQVLESAKTRNGAVPMAIIIQSHLTAVTAGVISSCHPNEADFGELYCEAVNGDGARLVDGSHKPSSFRLTVTGGSVTRSTPGADGPATLDADTALTLSSWVLELERITGLPQDIEWVHDGARIWCMQARPLTSLTLATSLSPSECSTSWFFDQRFQKPISPITRTTLIPQIHRASIEDPLRMAGYTEIPEPFYYGGQIYVPHSAYRRMFSGIPRALLTPDLKQLFPRDCYCTQQKAFPRFWHALRSLFQQRKTALRTIHAWDQFRNRLSDRLACFAKLPDPANPDGWTKAWNALCGMTDEFLAIHRWSILYADLGFHYFRTAATGHLALPTFRANAQRAEFVAGRMDETQQRDFFAAYGHRSGSLDLAEPTWAEHAGSDPTPQTTLRDRTDHPRERGLRRLLQMREEQRFEWERILAVQHLMLRDAGRYLARDGRLAEASDVWFLEWNELQELMRAPEFGARFSERIATRRHQMAVSHAARKPLFIGPGGINSPETPGQLRGLGVSAGEAGGIVFVHPGPMDYDLPIPANCILVLRSLDPAWTWIMPSIRGLVLERGGLLSHAAMMAREYNLPTITNVQDAATILKSGMKVLINGESGIITVENP